MAEFTEQDRQKIVDALIERNAIQPCSRCATNKWSVVDGYYSFVPTPDRGTIVLGGRSIPAAVIICVNCGLIVYHSLGVLGLLKSDEEPSSSSGELQDKDAEGGKSNE